MLIEIEGPRDHWRAHDVSTADGDLPAAAYAAVRASHDFLTDENHTREAGSDDGPRSGAVVIVRAQDAEPIENVSLRRLAEWFGSRHAGDYWFSVRWREWHPHKALAVDDHGRRWAMVRMSSGYGMWECMSDPLELPWAVPGPAPGRACCGNPNTAEGRTCERHGGPWRLPVLDDEGGVRTASDVDLAVAGAVRWNRRLLRVLVDLTAGRRTPTQAAEDLRCGRGQAGRDSLLRRTLRVRDELREAHAMVPGPACGLSEAALSVLTLAGVDVTSRT
jgi:hypothetical protein